MELILKRFENSKFVKLVQSVFNSVIFPVITAVVVLACYYLSLDLLAFWYLSVCGVLILLTCRDITPFFLIILFLNLPISYKNSPSPNNPNASDYYFKAGNVAQLVLMACLMIACVIIRVVEGIISKRFKLSPVFFGVCALGAAFIFNGVLYSRYEALDLMYGCALAAIYVGFFVFISGNTKMEEGNVKKLASYLLALFAVLAVELFIMVFATEGVYVNGKLNRDKMFYGWATYNNMGVLLVAIIPAWFYLSAKCKNGWLFLLGAAFNLGTAFLSMSRQSMVMSVVIFAACCVWNLITVKGRDRIVNAVVLALIIIFSAVFINLALGEEIGVFFEKLLNDNESGSGRLVLWERGFGDFLHRPLFGIGFFGGDIGGIDYGASGLDKVPRFYHNTFVQLAASCGIAGLAAYIVHRTQTVISFLKNVNSERIFVALAAMGIALCSLLDVHIFSPFAAMIYAMLFTFFITGEDMKSEVARQKEACAAEDDGAPFESAPPAIIYNRTYDNNCNINADNISTEDIMEEERGLSLGDIFKIIGKRIMAVIAATLAVALIAGLLVQFWYNRKKQTYTIKYELDYPGKSSNLYPDGTNFNYKELASLERLKEIKASDESFANIDVESMASDDDITIEDIRIVESSTTAGDNYYLLNVKAKYFKSPEQAEKFIRALIEDPIKKINAMVETTEYKAKLTAFDKAKTYEDKMIYLSEQKLYLYSVYDEMIAGAGNGYYPVNGISLDNYRIDVENTYTAQQAQELSDKLNTRHYVFEADEYISWATSRIDALEKEIDDNEITIADLKREYKDTFGLEISANITMDNPFAVTIRDLEIANSVNRKDIRDINKALSEIENQLDSEGHAEFKAKLEKYKEELSDLTDILKTVRTAFYAEKTEINLRSNKISASGGISMLLAALVGAVAGFVIASVAVVIIDGENYKKIKYGELAVAQSADAEENCTSADEGGEDKELLTVSGVLEGEDGADEEGAVEPDGGAVTEEAALKKSKKSK